MIYMSAKADTLCLMMTTNPLINGWIGIVEKANII